MIIGQILTVFQNVTGTNFQTQISCPDGILRRIHIAGGASMNGGTVNSQQFGEVLVGTVNAMSNLSRQNSPALLAASVAALDCVTAAGFSSVSMNNNLYVDFPVKDGDLLYVWWNAQTNVNVWAYVQFLFEIGAKS